MGKQFLLAGSALMMMMATPAFAQSVDYSSLESIFGGPVTTSATGTPQRASEAPANMTIVTADEIRRSGSRNIPEALAMVSGLDILRVSTNSYDIGVRGYQQPFQPRLLVLIDGRQVFLDDYSRTAWDNLPVNIDDIRQIEIVKGAASALFGSNAVGGVINILTYSPVYDDSNVVNVGGGTQNTLTGDGTFTKRGEWGGTKFSFGGMRADEFNTFHYPLDQSPEDPEKQYLVNSTVFQLTPMLQAFTEATYANSKAYTADPTDAGIMGSQRTTTYSVRGGTNWQSPYGLIGFNNYLNHSYISLDEPTDGGAPYAFTMDLFVSQLQDQFKWGPDHTFRVGLEYRYKNFKMDAAQLAYQEPQLEENNYAVSGTWLWKLSPSVTWSNAVRFDHLSMEEVGTLMENSVYTYADYSHVMNTWSGNSDIVYKATEKDSFRLGVGRGVQLPSLINSGYGIYQDYGGHLSNWEGNPRLKPTTVTDVGLDYTRKLPEISSSLKAAVFYEWNENIVSPLQMTGTVVIDGAPQIFGESVNVGGSQGYGGEIGLKGGLNGFRWNTSYSFQRVIDDPEVATYVNYQGSAPQHHFRFGLGYTTGPWEMDGTFHATTHTDMLRSYDGGWEQIQIHKGGYTSLNGRVGYSLTDKYTVAVSGTNLTRKFTGTSPYPQIERQAFINLTGRF